MEQLYDVKEHTTKNGIHTISVNGYFLHSKYNPQKEALEFVEKNFKPGYVHILFGYGLGYIAEELVSRFTSDEERLIVIEPILKNIINSNEKVTVFIESDMEKLKDTILSMFSIIDNVTILCSPNYDKICPEIYKQLLLNLKNKLNLERVNENTLILLSETWQRNYLMNLKNAINDISIKHLKKITSSPIVIASGGPSLTKQLPLIKKFRENFILIASGSTINSLLSEGIIPDFVVSIDGSIINYDHYKDIKNREIILLYGMYNHYKIREIFDTAYYFFSQENPSLTNHMENIFKDKPIVMMGGGSVAHYALTIANYLTNGSIALVGQDLAYTNNLSHALNNKRLSDISDEIKKKSTFIEAKGYNDDVVLTDYPFLSMKLVFEKLIKILNNKNIYNCTEGGIKLEGYEQLSFSDFCEKFAKKKVKKDLLKKKKDSQDLEMKRTNRLKKTIQKEMDNFDKLIKILKESLELLSNNKDNKSFDQKILNKLDFNDEKIESYINKTSIGVILDPINLIVLKRFVPKKDETIENIYKRVLEQNKVLYSEYLIAVQNTRKYALELINSIEEVGENL